MALLILLSVTQLVVLCCLLRLVWLEAVQRETERLTATSTIRGLQRRTIKAMFEVARPDLTIDSSGHDSPTD